MTDDICGYEDTTTGEPCQHPAGSCPVPSHSDSDAENPQGRDFSIEESDREDILEAARDGLSKAGCARAAGVSRPELNRYLDAHDAFRSAFRRARNEGEQTLVSDGLRDDDVDTSMAKFLLASSFGYKKTERREVDATVDQTTTHELDDETKAAIREGLAARRGG